MGMDGAAESYERVVSAGDVVAKEDVIERLMRAVREHLHMDVAFVGQLSGTDRVFRYVDSDVGVDGIEAGDADPLEDSYCGHVLSRDLPELLLDPMEHPVSAAMPVTSRLPVGSHLSVPIQFSDGRVYGTFCCFAFDVRSSLNEEHLDAVRMVAQLAGEYIEALDEIEREQRDRRRVIEAVLADPEGIQLVFQPLRNLETMEIVAVEALARFPGHAHGPEWFFAEAVLHGLDLQLEMRAVELALDVLARIPASIHLNVNVSPDTLHGRRFLDAIAEVPGGRVVVEVTEHAVIEDYTETKRAAAKLAQLGVRLAIDDVGMGFSGLNRILETSPQELKLDAAVTSGVHDSPVKQALVEAFCAFGARADFDVVAEGIENEDQLQCLRELGVTIGQGYHLGHPGPLDAVLSASP
jgi:EAL domain-containing protein (putative c-di-GMP-specific phosphodiesterase class I)